MTYCVGMLLRHGLVLMADSRTNAGVDQISSYRKLHLLADGDDRIVAVATSGNLSVTQTALATLAEGLAEPGDDQSPQRVSDMPGMFRVAQLVGRALGRAREGMQRQLEAAKVSSTASMLLAGRVCDEPLRLFHVYSVGNFVECQEDQVHQQIGETKYGKPILDRALRYDTSLEEAVKIGLISFDSTIRSNLAVGLPIDLLAIPVERGAPCTMRRVERDDPYFADLSARWSMLLTEALDTIPEPPFMAGRGQH